MQCLLPLPKLHKEGAMVFLLPNYTHAERGSSAVERRTLNRGSPVSNPLCYSFELGSIFVHCATPQFTQVYKTVVEICGE